MPFTLRHKTGQREMISHHNMLKAMDLRTAGKTYQEIAEEIGFANRGTAYRAVMRALKSTKAEKVPAVRKLELGRLDRMIRAIWDRVELGQPDAIQSALNIMKRRAALLGMDAPQEILHKVDRDTIAQSVESKLARLTTEGEALGLPSVPDPSGTGDP